jgi:predicted GNAT superfamily acetyltransferase
MGGVAVARDAGAMDAIEIRPAARAELPAGARLLAGSLGFGDRDAIPAWLMQDAVERGALALGAFAASGLVGFSYAVPAVADGRTFLFSSGLAVEPGRRGSGLGRRLKEAQRSEALARGYDVIRWTADPLAVPALRLYLSGLGARIVGYRPDAYRGVRADGGIPHDDVDVEWRLAAQPPPDDGTGGGPSVELPLDRAVLGTEDAARWRQRGRGELYERLAGGWEGVAVRIDRAAGRAWLDLAATG